MGRTFPWNRKAASTAHSSSFEKVENTHDNLSSPPCKRQRSNSYTSSPIESSFTDVSPLPETGVMLFSDAAYRLVEDELLQVAQSYTRRLHRAEYSRLKAQALEKSSSQDPEILRPTDKRTSMSADLRLRTKRRETERRIQKALAPSRQRRPASDDEIDFVVSEIETEIETETDDDEESLNEVQLKNLLTSPRHSKSLVGLQGVKSSTRAALGFSRNRSKTQEEDTADDDLDAGLSSSPPIPKTRHAGRLPVSTKSSKSHASILPLTKSTKQRRFVPKFRIDDGFDVESTKSGQLNCEQMSSTCSKSRLPKKDSSNLDVLSKKDRKHEDDRWHVGKLAKTEQKRDRNKDEVHEKLEERINAIPTFLV